MTGRQRYYRTGWGTLCVCKYCKPNKRKARRAFKRYMHKRARAAGNAET